MHAVIVRASGASDADFLAAIIAAVGGAAKAAWGAGANQAASTLSGTASPCAVIDAAYGVVSAPTAGGAAKSYRITQSAGVLSLAAVVGWSAVTHTAQSQTQAVGAVTLSTSVIVIATDEALVVLAGGLASYVVGMEIADPLPIVSASPWGVMSDVWVARMPSVKSPSAAGYAADAALTTIAPAALSTGRSGAETQYHPLVPVLVSYGGTTLGTLRGLRQIPDTVGGTGSTIVADSGETVVALRKLGQTINIGVTRR
jgi:hypothetical protein